MIGVFDSGVGGLSVWKELIKLIPQAEYTYIADSGNCPYGPKPKEFIIERSKTICDFLIKNGASIIVIACNTATAAAVNELRNIYSIPIVGMEPAIKPAALNTKTGTIGILATKGTFNGTLYKHTREVFADNKQVIEQIGKGLVEIVENGMTESKEAYNLLSSYLQPMIDKNADQLVLGCTHYPFLSKTIQHIVGNKMEIINPAPSVALRISAILNENNMTPDKTSLGKTTFYTTGKNIQLIKTMVAEILKSEETSDSYITTFYSNNI